MITVITPRQHPAKSTPATALANLNPRARAPI